MLPTLLLEVVISLIDSRLPWTCEVLSYLLQKKCIHSAKGTNYYGKGNVSNSG